MAEKIDLSTDSDESDLPSDSDHSNADTRPSDGAKMALKAVTNVLKKLSDNNNGIYTENHFCAEHLLLSKYISVSVDGFGKLKFPISEEDVEALIKVSTKAKFGKGEKTLLDTNIRDTQVIPADKLKVDFNNEALNQALKRIAHRLKIDENINLVPHLYNILIYGPGQFFKKHKDSEKVKNMVATMVILLPSFYEGGELLIYHKKKQHSFFGSDNPDVVKCVAFYADCEHEILKVEEGYRVAITFNVALDVPNQQNNVEVNSSLNDVVDSYFSQPDIPKKLVFYFNHEYSQASLNWGLLKASDRTCALALLAVAEKQGRVPFLALSTYHTTHGYNCDSYKYYERYYNSDDDELLEEEIELDFWVDVRNSNVTTEFGTCSTHKSEITYTTDKIDIFEPYEETDSGPTGNEGGTKEKWYRRGCIVLWESELAYPAGLKQCLDKLHQLTTQVGNENHVLETLKKIGHFWNKSWVEHIDTLVTDKLVEMIMNTNDLETGKLILSKLPDSVFRVDQMERLLKLETQFSADLWVQVCKSWVSVKKWSEIVNSTMDFINAYKINTGSVSKSVIVDTLLKEVMEGFVKSRTTWLLQDFITNKKTWYSHGQSDVNTAQKLVELLQTCIELNQIVLVSKLFSQLVASVGIVDVTDFFLRFYDTLICEKHKSLIVDTVLKEVLELILQDSNKTWPLSEKCNEKTTQTLIKLLQTCTELNKSELGSKLISDLVSKVPTVYNIVDVSHLFLNLYSALSSDAYFYYKSCKECIISKLNKEIKNSEATLKNWSIKVTIPCNCKFCIPVQKCLQSDVSNKVVVSAAEANRRHVISFLRKYKGQPFKYYIDKNNGTPHKLIVEKDPNMFRDRATLYNNLLKIKSQLEGISISTPPKSHEKEVNRSPQLQCSITSFDPAPATESDQGSVSSKRQKLV